MPDIAPMPAVVPMFSAAPATDADIALRQNLMLGQCSWFSELCRLLPTPLAILNTADTVVQANPALLRLAGLPQGCDLVGWIADPDQLLGLGLVSRPYLALGESFRIFSADGAGTRPALERIFFHDLMNTAGGVRGLSEVMADAPADELPALTASVRDLAGQLVEEIAAHRDLMAAESGDLRVDPRPQDAHEVMRLVAARYRGHPVTGHRQIVIVPGPGAGVVVTDAVLLGRILGNMVKNALEAIGEEGVVTLDSGRSGGMAWFSVHNGSVIPETDLPRLFDRRFSTKGSGRGLGTWSMKMLAESYLKGRVTVTSDAALGTTFRVSLPISGT
ncbi:MAG TPA: ATP-binding protein [Candidatus Krumholzibacteria bacterium]|nr:ATP-binding protein [Candidatus Krumholzibacteria bacterium]